MSAPLVSVVIPAYNREATIRAAIESVLRQSWTDYELLVVDDGSSDNTLAAAAEISDPRLRLIGDRPNTGAAGARNAGAAAARGTWLAFQDSDDEWLPGKLARQMARLLAPGADFVGAYCGLLTLGGLASRPGERLTLAYTPRPAVSPVEGDILEPLLGGNMVSTQTLVVRRDLFEKLGGFDPDLTPIEDWDFAIRLAQAGPVACIDEPLVHQRFSPNSITRDRARATASRIRLVEKNIAAFSRHPARLARQYELAACGLRDAGDFHGARRFAALARRTAPATPRLWAREAEMRLRALRQRSPA
jgi:glycosyltransferase involved in cell wall biosynthesis